MVLTCVTDANPPASQYRFYRDGVFLRTGFTGKYIIEKARGYDAGRYVCAPINSLGSGVNSSEVEVSVFGEYQFWSFKEKSKIEWLLSVYFFIILTFYTFLHEFPVIYQKSMYLDNFFLRGRIYNFSKSDVLKKKLLFYIQPKKK